MKDSPEILIIRLSSLGDILHALPAFADLRASFPEAKIDWLVAEKCRFLVDTVPGINAVHVLDADSLLRFPPSPAAWNRLWNLIRDLRKHHYDFSIDFQGLIKTAVLGLLSGAQTRLGFSKNMAREYPAHWFYHRSPAKPKMEIHVSELNRILAGMTGAHPVSSPADFKIPENDRRQVESLMEKEQLSDFAVINPGGGWPTKRWSPEKYGDLAKRIKTEIGLSIVVTTGPGEGDYFQKIAERCGDFLPHHFPVTFLQLIPLLKRAGLFIGGDTGPFHLACALGTPVVGIFGPTSPVRNGPWKAEDECVAHTLPCSFCYGRSCPTHNECMDISVDEVFAAVNRRLGNRGRHSDARC
jgi:lipopolysaccharide heptosyltransferase I